MKRFLVVGCGGSGGSTLAYMMDQLRSDLAGYGVGGLPRGWQFVHVDVPTSPDEAPDGLGDVRQQGGRYLGLGPRTGSYAELDRALSERLAAAQALDTIGTWAPRSPEQVRIPLSVGAGQYRAVGRMVTLTKAADLRRGLQAAWDDLFRVETTTEMAYVAESAPGVGPFDALDSPIVLVVSSMAGGAGASMALDVCRLLTLIDGLDPSLMAVFMVSPDIFDSLPESARSGVRANAMAMLGEIVASQSGSARPHDVGILAALGQQNGAGATVPFARVFPVGRFVGAQRTTFGDGSPKSVYRGLGRGLAGLLMSSAATNQFVSFDLGNAGSVLPAAAHLGWGAESPTSLPWGSFGFASLSMGRDRYAEYAAQRIARSCIDHLLRGHLQPGNNASGNEQVKALLDSQWDAACQALELPTGTGSPQQGDAEMGRWLTFAAFPRAQVEAIARKVADQELANHLPSAQGVQATQWVPALRQRLATRRHALTDAANQAAYEWVFEWQRGFLARTGAAAEDAVARFGLPYATALLERLSLHLREVVIPGADNLSRHAPANLGDLPSDLADELGTLRGVIADGQRLLEEVVTRSRQQVLTQVYAQASGLARDVLSTFVGDVLAPLMTSVAESQTVLERACDSTVRHDGLAVLATDSYVAWPSDEDERVPARFSEADNEVMLTSSSDFPPQYVADLQRSVGVEGISRGGFEQAREAVTMQVVRGVWNTTGGNRHPGGLLEVTTAWKSRVITRDPETGNTLVPSPARFDLHVRPTEVLNRARAFVGRPQESFSRFCTVSLRDFVRGAGAPESEKASRASDVAAKFREALALALPLAGVNEGAVKKLHNNREVEYRYKFSAVPFGGLAVADVLRRTLEANPSIDSSSRDNLEQSLGDEDQLTRIDLFGSYPLYSPLVFDSLLGPVAKQWAETPPEGRRAFWTHRRTRPLAASLPLSDRERQAMVAGWLLGQLLGEIRIPSFASNLPVEIWDPVSHQWAHFPHPLLTAPNDFVHLSDWLPAVMESMLLAISRAHEVPVLGSLRPYRLLRDLYDDNPEGPTSHIWDIAAERNLSTWLRTGTTRGGAASQVEGADTAESIDDRAAMAKQWLNVRSLAASTHFMAPGHDGAAGGGKFSIARTRAAASATPLLRDLAPDIRRATAALTELIDKAVLTAKQPAADSGQAEPPDYPDDPTGVPMPAGGVF